MQRATSLRRGQSLVTFAVFAVTLFIFMGFGIDAGMIYLERRHLQNDVDAACLAAATDIAMGKASTAAASATSYFTTNRDANADLAFNAAITPTVQISGSDVRVSVSTTAQSYFLQFADVVTYSVGARAHCDATEGGGIWPVAVVRFPGYKPVGNDPTQATERVGVANTGLELPQLYGNGNQPKYVVVRDVLQASSVNTGVLNGGLLSGTGCSSMYRNWYDWPSLGSPPAPWGSGPSGPYRQSCAPATLTDPGYEVEMAGQGADPNVPGGGAYSGPLLLDYRQVSFTPHLFYNGMDDQTATNSWKDRIVQNILEGYKGPDVLPGQELAVVDGVSAGNILASIRQRYKQNDVVTALVYNGVQYKDPNFTLQVTCAQGQAPFSDSCNNNGNNGGKYVERRVYTPPTPETCQRDGRYYVARPDAAFTSAPSPAEFRVKLTPVAGGGVAAAAQTVRLTARGSDSDVGSDYDGSAGSFGKLLVRWEWSNGSTGWQTPDTPVDVDVPLPNGVEVKLFVVQSDTQECTPAPTALNPTPVPVTIPKRVSGTQTIEVTGRSAGGNASSRQHSDFAVLGVKDYTGDFFLSFATDPNGTVKSPQWTTQADLSIVGSNGNDISSTTGLSATATGGISATIDKQGQRVMLKINASGAATGEYAIDVQRTDGSHVHTVRYYLRVEPPSNPSIDSWVVALCYANWKITDMSSPNVVKGRAVSGCLNPDTITTGLRARLLPW